MTTIREFDHDGSRFQITQQRNDNTWLFRVICDENIMVETVEINDMTMADGVQDGRDLASEAADDLEDGVRRVRGLEIREAFAGKGESE